MVWFHNTRRALLTRARPRKPLRIETFSPDLAPGGALEELPDGPSAARGGSAPPRARRRAEPLRRDGRGAQDRRRRPLLAPPRRRAPRGARPGAVEKPQAAAGEGSPLKEPSIPGGVPSRTARREPMASRSSRVASSARSDT